MNIERFRKTMDLWVSGELKRPRKLSRIRPEICDFEPDFGLNTAGPKQALSIRDGTRRPAQNDAERVWADFGVNCEIL